MKNLSSHPTHRRRQKTSRRGVALLFVILAVAVAVILGLTFLLSQSVFMGISRNVHDHAVARTLAESAIVNAVAQIQAEEDWRSTVAEGLWSKNTNYLGGQAAVYGYDGEDTNNDGIIEGDGSLADNTGDPVTLRAIGYFGEASHTVTVVLLSSSGEAPDFEIDGGTVVSREPVQAQVVSVGAAISSGSTDLPVTLRITIDGNVFEPFGAFDDPINANLNDRSDQPDFKLPDIYPEDAEISVEARSWQKKRWWYSGSKSKHWRSYMTVDSSDNTPQVKVLRNGDSVPEISGYGGQASVADFVSDYINAETGLVQIADHQAIFLFELGTTRLTSSAADFQDLVMLLNLGKPGETFDEGGGGGEGPGAGSSGFTVRWK